MLKHAGTCPNVLQYTSLPDSTTQRHGATIPGIQLSHLVSKLFLLTYLLTPWNTVLLEKLTGSAASQEIPRIFGTRMFITVLTSARHMSLS